MYMCVKVLYFGRFKPAWRGKSQWRPVADAGAMPKSEPAKKRNKGRKRKVWWAWKMGKGPKPKTMPADDGRGCSKDGAGETTPQPSPMLPPTPPLSPTSELSPIIVPTPGC